MSDPPDHDRRRKILNQQLVPRRMQDRESSSLHTLGNTSPGCEGTIEAVHDLGAAFSVSVVGDLVGLPEEGCDQLVQCALDSFDMWGPEGERHDLGKAGFRRLLDYVEQVAIPARLTPGRWGTEIFDAATKGEVDASECHGIIQGYIHAGMDTTTSAIASAIVLFGQHPHAWQAVRTDRALLSGAINEAIRLYSPVQRYTRFTTTDTDVDGSQLPAESRVVVLIGSANRDERRFMEPNRFDITRRATDHIGFGFGIHHCAGEALAKTEMLALFDVLADQVDAFEVGEPTWGENAALHGLATLPVTLHTA